MPESLVEADLFDLFEFIELDMREDAEDGEEDGDYRILSQEDNSIVIAEFAQILSRVSKKKIIMYKINPKRYEKYKDIAQEGDYVFIIYWRNLKESEK